MMRYDEEIANTDIYPLNYFTYKRAFTGSYGEMRYRLRMEQEEGTDAALVATVYPQPFCWEETPDEQKVSKEFAFSEEGRSEMIAWLNEKVKEYK